MDSEDEFLWRRIWVTREELLKILHDFDEDTFEAEPLDALNFCNLIFNKYRTEPIKQEESSQE
jgi:hypothetical protein